MAKKTIIEKILSAHAGRTLSAGDVGICKVDFCFSQDGTTSLVVDSINKSRKLNFSNWNHAVYGKTNRSSYDS